MIKRPTWADKNEFLYISNKGFFKLIKIDENGNTINSPVGSEGKFEVYGPLSSEDKSTYINSDGSVKDNADENLGNWSKTEVSAPDSLLVNGKTGETVLVDEKGAEKAKSVQNLKDGEVPLGKGSGDQDNSAKAQVAAVTSSLPFIVGVSLAGLAILFFYQKKKKWKYRNK